MIKRTGLLIITFFSFFLTANLWVLSKFEVENYPLEKEIGFDEFVRTDYRDEISKLDPGAVIVGDSAIRQLDRDIFSKVLNMRTYIRSAPGSASAYWYLFIRNAIFPSDAPVQYALIFFRNTTLTTPGFLIHGSYFEKLDEIGGINDMDVFNKAVQSKKSPLVRTLERYVPIFSYRSEIYSNFSDDIRNFLPALALNCGPECVDEAFEFVLDDREINALLWEEYLLNLNDVLYSPENLDFDARVDQSFLPNMISDTQEEGMIPVFIRVKYRSHAEGKEDPVELEEYLTDLENYIEGKGGLFIDLENEPALTEDMYRDNIHIDEESAVRATYIIAQDVLAEINRFMEKK